MAETKIATQVGGHGVFSTMYLVSSSRRANGCRERKDVDAQLRTGLNTHARFSSTCAQIDIWHGRFNKVGGLDQVKPVTYSLSRASMLGTGHHGIVKLSIK